MRYKFNIYNYTDFSPKNNTNYKIFLRAGGFLATNFTN